MKKIFSLMLLCTAVVFASCSNDDDSATTPVAVSGISLDQTTLSIVAGETGTLKVSVAPEDATDKSVTWTTSEPTIATVSNTGVVTAIKAGSATITVTSVADNTKEATCEVTITAAPIAVTSITLNKTTTSIIKSAKETLIATVAPAEATNKVVTWSSSNTSIATVNATTGEVEGKAIGEATIIATSTENTSITGTCKVTVIENKTIEWAKGNLVANGANGAKIGNPTDAGLLFQFGSLVGWNNTGSPTIVVKPVGCTVASWNSAWAGDAAAADDAITGKGDPCRYYLEGTWRLPTKNEYVKLLENNGYPTTGPWKWENSSATNSTLGLTFPASGYRLESGTLLNASVAGSYWTTSLQGASNRWTLYLTDSRISPDSSDNMARGLSVRCVQEK